jgi:hypothetical protein
MEAVYRPFELSPAKQTELRLQPLKFQSCLTLLESAYDVHAYLTKQPPVQKPRRRKTFLAVYRQSHDIKVELLDPAFYFLLQKLEAGKTLTSAIDEISHELSAPEIRRLQKNVSRWLQASVAWSWGRASATRSAACRPGQVVGS